MEVNKFFFGSAYIHAYCFVLGGCTAFNRAGVMWPVCFLFSIIVCVCSSLHCLLCVCVDRRLNITAEADCRKLHCALRDLSSLLQAVGRLAEFFTGDVFTARFNDALAIVQRSVTLFSKLFTSLIWWPFYLIFDPDVI